MNKLIIPRRRFITGAAALLAYSALPKIPRAATIINPFILGGEAATISFTANAADAADQSTVTFSGQAIGTAATDRIVVIGVTCNAGEPITSATIGGISAASVVEGDALGGTAYAALWQASVPTGATADIVINLTGTSFRTGLGVWAIYGASSTVTDTGSSIADPSTDTLNISAGGVAIGMANSEGVSTSSYTWTNLTENFDSGLGEGTGAYSGASAAFAAEQTALSITADPTSGSAWAMACASWPPA